MNKKIPKTGSIAHNFHEGSRSEYFAQYIFSSIGTSVQVPHHEDSGLDLICGLGELKGNNEFIYNHYYIQIKSDKKDIIYEHSDSVEWIKTLKHPLFICIINKRTNIMEIFQTLMISAIYHFSSVEKICLSFKSDSIFKAPDAKSTEIVLKLGEPILSFNISNMTDKVFIEKFRNIMDYWIRVDQYNIHSRSIGFPFILHPSDFEKNEMPADPKSFSGNFLDISDKSRLDYKDSLYKQLSLHLLEASIENNEAKYMEEVKKVRDFIGSGPQSDNWGIRLIIGIDELVMKNRFGKKSNFVIKQ